MAMETRNIDTIGQAERAAQLWLSIDGVLDRIAVSRSKLWLMIRDGQFPPPYKHRGHPIWTQADISTFIDSLVSNTVQPKSEKTPVTWDQVAELFASTPGALTNKQVTFLLDAEPADVSALTRIMAKAGTLRMYKPLRDGAGAPNFYVAPSVDPMD